MLIYDSFFAVTLVARQHVPGLRIKWTFRRQNSRKIEDPGNIESLVKLTPKSKTVKNILTPAKSEWARKGQKEKKKINLVFAVDDEFVTIWRLFSQEYDAR